jgi:uncharacterized protein DUF3105
VSSRKEQKEALRRERLERERQAKEAARRKRLVGYGVGGALALAALIAVAVVLLAGGGGGEASGSEMLPDGGSVPDQRVTDLGAAVKAAGCRLESYTVKIGASSDVRHTQDPNERIPYQSNPPAGGKHFQVPADDGAYSEAPPDTALVHSLEHGRVVIWFKPGLPRDSRATLKALFDEDSYQMLITPRRNMPYDVAATAWNRDPEPRGTGRVLGCPRFSPKVVDALRAFRDEYRSDGPEAVP